MTNDSCKMTDNIELNQIKALFRADRVMALEKELYIQSVILSVHTSNTFTITIIVFIYIALI